MSGIITELLVTLTKDGHAICKLCARKWRLSRQPNGKRRCPGCRKVVFPRGYNPYKCHPICSNGLCSYLTLDWIVCRSSWIAVPTKDGLRWQTHEAVPTNSHDMMLHFKCTKWPVMMFWKRAMREHWLVRVRELVKPPVEIHEQKHKAYFYNRDKKWRRPTKRARRPTFIQYYPTSRALEVFRSRFPDGFRPDSDKSLQFWNPIYTDVSSIVVKPTIKIVPWSDAEKEAYVLRLSGMATDKRVGKAKNLGL